MEPGGSKLHSGKGNHWTCYVFKGARPCQLTVFCDPAREVKMPANKFFIVVDADGDREGPTHDTKAEAIDWARNNLNSVYGKAPVIMEAVAQVAPASPPVTVVDL